MTLRNVKSSLQADVQKYQAYLTNLESHVAILDQKLESVNDEVETAGKEALITVRTVKLEIAFK